MKCVKGRIETLEQVTKFPVSGSGDRITQDSLRAEGYEETDFVPVEIMGFTAPSLNTLKDTAKSLIREDILEDNGYSYDSHRINVGEWDRVTVSENEEYYVVHVEVVEKKGNLDVERLYYGLRACTKNYW